MSFITFLSNSIKKNIPLTLLAESISEDVNLCIASLLLNSLGNFIEILLEIYNPSDTIDFLPAYLGPISKAFEFFRRIILKIRTSLVTKLLLILRSI